MTGARTIHYLSGHPRGTPLHGAVAGVKIEVPVEKPALTEAQIAKVSIPCPWGDDHSMTRVTASKYERWHTADADDEHPSVTCPICFMTSFHPMDASSGWCGNCRDYTSDPIKD